MSRRMRATGAIVVAAAVTAAICLIVFWPSAKKDAVAAPPPPIPTVTPTVTPTPTGPPHEYVAAAAPTAFTLTGPAFTIRAHVCKMDFILPLDPPGDQFHTVCWVYRKFGVAPGSDTQGTSYILGHAWAEAKLVLNPLSEFAMKRVNLHRPVKDHGVPTYPVPSLNGYKIVLKTSHGTLSYTVDRAFAVSKEDAIKVPSIMATTTPNRVVVITCGVNNGVDIDDNIVVYASLTSSIAV